MKEMRDIPTRLREKDAFSRKEFVDAMVASYELTEPQIAYDLKCRLDERSVVRVGWNQYAFPRKKVYRHTYSSAAVDVAERIKHDYTGALFQIAELVQLNDFMNHQVAHNTIFVSIENDLVDFVFDSLWKAYPGRVMLKPNVNQYYRYIQDEEIIVQRLPSESPKGYGQPWQSRLEKILVDVFTDKLMSEIVPTGEKQAILDGAFNDFLIDESTMIRYAKRKGAGSKMKKILTEYWETVKA